MSIDYGIIVRSKTRLESLIERFNTKAQAKFYIERSGGRFEEYQQEHDTFYRSLEKLQTALSRVLKNKILYRSHLPNYIFSPNNIIIVIGQDGLVANTAKYANGVPIVAVNPDPNSYDGVLLPFRPESAITAIDQVVEGVASSKQVNFAEARLNDGQRLLAFNDLFIGAETHISARYNIAFDGKKENHSSSGIIVSTQAGSTGWLSSVFNMAYGITSLFDKSVARSHPRLRSDQLIFAVREPFKSVRTQTDISMGFIDARQELILESYMPNRGVIFSDGIEKDFLQFNSGSIVRIGLAKETAQLIQA
ncbi:MAG: sugar kinase [Bacteroidota bacterium]